MNQPAAFIESLNAREVKILSLIAEGFSYGEISQALFIEKATVTWYVQQIYDKLGLEKNQRNHQKAITYARELGLLEGKPTVADHKQANLPIKNPYKGLRSFQQIDANEFFGREALIKHLLQRLRESASATRFLAVVGPSGCGKSSVLHAGLIPALQQGGAEGSEHWLIANLVPGSHPLDELEAALARASGNPGINIMEQLLRDERGLQRVANMIMPEQSELLLVVDQFEELFSLVIDDEERRRFLSLLSCCVTLSHSRVRVIIALRADYYDRPLMTPEISELFRSRIEVVAPLSRAELAQAICLPAQQVGVQVESALEAAMIEEVSDRPGLLPLMQYSLTELFDQRQDATMTLEIYHKIGGIRGALTRQADMLYESLSEPQQSLMRQLFLRLVKLGAEGEVLRRRVNRAELDAIEKNNHLVDELIDTLAQHRLLTLDYDPTSGTAIVEIAHEALIREWNQLRAWIDDSREDIRQQRLLAAAASDWREAGRDPSYLLTGTHLVQFQTWAQSSQVELGPVESEFLKTSIAEKLHHDHRRRLTRNLAFGAVILIAVVMSGLAIFALDRENEAQVARIRAERGTNENRSIQMAARAQDAYNEGRTDRALLLAMQAVTMNDPPASSEQIFRIIAQGPGLRTILPGYPGQVNTLAISQDGKRILSGGCSQRRPDMVCLQGELTLWYIGAENASDVYNLRIFNARQSLVKKGMITDIAFKPGTAPNGRPTALSASEDGSIILWDVSSSSQGEVLQRYEGHAGAVNEVAFSPDGTRFVSAYDGGSIILWETDTGEEIWRLDGLAVAVTSAAFSPDGRNILTASEDGVTALREASTGTEVRRYPSPPGVSVIRLAFGPSNKNGNTTVWGLSSDYAVHVWDLDTAQEVDEISPGMNPYVDVGFSPDGKTAALAIDNLVILRSIGHGDEQRLMQTSQAAYTFVTCIAISTDGKLMVSGDDEGKIELWNLPVRNDVQFIPVAGVSSLDNAVLYPDDRYLLSSSGSRAGNSSVYKIDLVTGKIVANFPELPNPVSPNALAIDPNGRYILAGGGDKANINPSHPEEPYLWVLDADTGEVLHRLEGHHHVVGSIAISPDGRFALSGSTDYAMSARQAMGGELILWDMQTFTIIWRHDDAQAVSGIDFSHDGSLAVTSSPMPETANISVWEVSNGKRRAWFPYGSYAVAFSLDDKSIFIGALTPVSLSQIYQINTANGDIQRKFEGLDSPAFDIDLSPDGSYLFAASTNRALLWDMNSTQEISRFDLPASTSAWAVFPSNSTSAFIVQDMSKQIIQWHINDLLSLDALNDWIVKNRYLRDWTCDERRMYEIQPYCSGTQSVRK